MLTLSRLMPRSPSNSAPFLLAACLTLAYGTRGQEISKSQPLYSVLQYGFPHIFRHKPKIVSIKRGPRTESRGEVTQLYIFMLIRSPIPHVSWSQGGKVFTSKTKKLLTQWLQWVENHNEPKGSSPRNIADVGNEIPVSRYFEKTFQEIICRSDPLIRNRVHMRSLG